ncbi:hypothetical protein [Bordetella petrii]|uniref:hypothetical protein n=1 Tax=Bordetella petrii TaxID=94624 RepID=UPI001E5EA517|nr:hypothetical protein [Bordetella petrii]MCD0501898.1 hypothetical protein [Bordetella petrii]
MLASLHRLPLGVRGWLLQQARCLPASHAWSCSASYVRAQPDATNSAFMQALPAGWQLQFRPLDEVELSWSVPGQGISLAQVDPPSPSRVDTVVASALQRVRPAFSQLSLAAPSPAPIAAPRDSQGRAMGLPPAWPSLRQRTLVLQGPLRSFALLADQPLVVGWSSLVLRLAAGHAPSTTVSSLTAELQGVLYEQD